MLVEVGRCCACLVGRGQQVRQVKSGMTHARHTAHIPTLAGALRTRGRTDGRGLLGNCKHTMLPRCQNDVGTCQAIRRGVGEVSEQNGVGPTQLRHSHIGAVNRSIALRCLDVGAVSEKCRSIAPTCLDVGAVSEKCRSIAPMCLDVGEVSEKCRSIAPTRLRHSYIGAVNQSIALRCLDVGAVSDKCRSIAPMCLDVGAVSEKCWRTLQNCFGVGPTRLRHSHIGAVHRSNAPRGLDVGAVSEKCWKSLLG